MAISTSKNGERNVWLEDVYKEIINKIIKEITTTQQAQQKKKEKKNKMDIIIINTHAASVYTFCTVLIFPAAQRTHAVFESRAELPPAHALHPYEVAAVNS